MENKFRTESSPSGTCKFYLINLWKEKQTYSFSKYLTLKEKFTFFWSLICQLNPYTLEASKHVAILYFLIKSMVFKKTAHKVLKTSHKLMDWSIWSKNVIKTGLSSTQKKKFDLQVFFHHFFIQIRISFKFMSWVKYIFLYSKAWFSKIYKTLSLSIEQKIARATIYSLYLLSNGNGSGAYLVDYILLRHKFQLQPTKAFFNTNILMQGKVHSLEDSITTAL